MPVDLGIEADLSHRVIHYSTESHFLQQRTRLRQQTEQQREQLPTNLSFGPMGIYGARSVFPTNFHHVGPQ